LRPAFPQVSLPQKLALLPASESSSTLPHSLQAASQLEPTVRTSQHPALSSAALLALEASFRPAGAYSAVAVCAVVWSVPGLRKLQALAAESSAAMLSPPAEL